MNPPDPSEIVLTFLESVGHRGEAELYLELFRNLPKASFACIALDAHPLQVALSSLTQQLEFLRWLGLFTPVVIGLENPYQAELALPRLAKSLEGVGIESTRHLASEPRLAEKIRFDIENGSLPLICFEEATPETERFEALTSWLEALDQKKLVCLRGRGGLGPRRTPAVKLGAGHELLAHAGGISIIHLHTDLTPLLDSQTLRRADQRLLEQLAPICERLPRLQISVSSPLVLLKELFTVRGAGTLIKKGSIIHHHSSYDALDQRRLAELLEAAFKKPLFPGWPARLSTSIFLEESYRGAAILEDGLGAAFLTKFAVGPIARGEGLGRELWRALCRAHPSFYWRAKPNNPIGPWYAEQCDGLLRFPNWTVYFKGIEAERVPAIVQDALARPEDFRAETPANP